MARKYLLSIDGGGIRGIIPTVALAKLEEVTNRPARETFSFVAGTSTGALIAAAVAAGVPASRILNIYLERSREIFSPRKPLNLIKRLATGSMYSAPKLFRILSEEFGVAAAWKLNDCPIDILITAKAVADGMPWYFVRDKPGNAGTTGELGLLDCATASAAAPTYFAPWLLRDTQRLPARYRTPGVLVDGGVGVTGNPVYQACVEAFYYTREYDPEDTTIVSLGTGRFPMEEQPRGLWSWLHWILAELLRSPGEQQTEIVSRHFNRTPFYRINPDMRLLDPALTHPIGMDDVASVDRLREYGERLADMIDWQAILDGRDTRFLITPAKTLAPQYSVNVPPRA